MSEKKMYRTKRMRLKDKKVIDRPFEDLAKESMDTVSEFLFQAKPNEIPLSIIVETALRMELLIRWYTRHKQLDGADIQYLEDAILLRESNEGD